MTSMSALNFQRIHPRCTGRIRSTSIISIFQCSDTRRSSIYLLQSDAKIGRRPISFSRAEQGTIGDSRRGQVPAACVGGTNGVQSVMAIKTKVGVDQKRMKLGPSHSKPGIKGGQSYVPFSNWCLRYGLIDVSRCSQGAFFLASVANAPGN